ncbi:hypothetical protein U1Q18_003185, partial [Sarracenia purpurea var. burkii]
DEVEASRRRRSRDASLTSDFGSHARPIFHFGAHKTQRTKCWVILQNEAKCGILQIDELRASIKDTREFRVWRGLGVELGFAYDKVCFSGTLQEFPLKCSQFWGFKEERLKALKVEDSLIRG